ncbi:MAG: acetyl-CoA carboxylase biotin carboxyl carrier protein subunit [Betaproteobacteria bacterium]|jgi:acetyl-CoA carboxylase biotin carboxyl carrier protein
MHKSGDIRAEVAGQVIALHVEAGARCEAGQELLVVEAMKMEIPVLLDDAVRIVTWHVAPGDMVHEGQLLASVEPA